MFIAILVIPATFLPTPPDEMQILALLEGPLAAKHESRDLATTSKLDPPITTCIMISSKYGHMKVFLWIQKEDSNLKFISLRKVC